MPAPGPTGATISSLPSLYGSSLSSFIAREPWLLCLTCSSRCQPRADRPVRDLPVCTGEYSRTHRQRIVLCGRPQSAGRTSWRSQPDGRARVTRPPWTRWPGGAAGGGDGGDAGGWCVVPVDVRDALVLTSVQQGLQPSLACQLVEGEVPKGPTRTMSRGCQRHVQAARLQLVPSYVRVEARRTSAAAAALRVIPSLRAK